MMKFNSLKKVMLFILIALIIICAFSFILINQQIERAWGASVPPVEVVPFERPQGHYAIVNASVLDSLGEQMLFNQTLLINNGIIEAVGNDIAIPEDAEQIDASGMFLIPGLIDAHVHLWQSPNDLLLYLANGVTHIRELNGSEEHLQWRQQISQGRPGPDLFVASRRHNSTGLFEQLFHKWAAKVEPVTVITDMKTHVGELKAAGYDAIKVYTELSNDDFSTLTNEASHQGIPILGHIPRGLKLNELWSSNLKEIAHIEEFVKALDREFGGYTRDNTDDFIEFVRLRAPEIARNLAARAMAVVSTLALIEGIPKQKLNVQKALDQVALEYVNRGIAESVHPSVKMMGWHSDVNIYRLPDDYPQDRVAGNQRYWLAYAEANRILLSEMREYQVKVLAGTDANVPIMVPGFSIHDELKALVKAGYSPAAALRSATTETAQWMDLKTGKIAPGYEADLVMLSGNPLHDISNTQTTQGVMSNGRWYSKYSLAQMLVAVQEANGS